METSNTCDSSVMVSSVLLRHEMKFMAALRLPKSNPMLRNIMLEVREGKLHLTASDGHATVMTCLAVGGCSSFITAIKAEKFYAACDRLPGKESQLALSDGILTLTSGRFRGRYEHVADSVEAIRLQRSICGSGQTTLVKACSLCDILESVTPFVPRKPLVLKILHQDIGGVFLVVEDELGAFTTDGHRAFWATAPRDQGFLSARAFISYRYSELVKRITPQRTDTLFVALHDTDLRVECAPRVVVVRSALRSKIPVFDSINKMSSPVASATVVADEISGPVRRLRTAWAGKIRPIELNISPGKLILRAANEESFDGEEEVEAQTEGVGTCEVNANDVLKFVDGSLGECLSIEMLAKPAVVRMRSGAGQMLLSPLHTSKSTSETVLANPSGPTPNTK